MDTKTRVNTAGEFETCDEGLAAFLSTFGHRYDKALREDGDSLWFVFRDIKESDDLVQGYLNAEATGNIVAFYRRLVSVQKLNKRSQSHDGRRERGEWNEQTYALKQKEDYRQRTQD